MTAAGQAMVKAGISYELSDERMRHCCIALHGSWVSTSLLQPLRSQRVYLVLFARLTPAACNMSADIAERCARSLDCTVVPACNRADARCRCGVTRSAAVCQ